MKYLFLTVLMGVFYLANAQNFPSARALVDTLASPAMHGRGYVQEGDKLAAQYIQSQFENLGLERFEKSFFQGFNLPINTFPQTPTLKLGKQKLELGKDYIPHSAAGAGKGKFVLCFFNKKEGFLTQKFENKVLVFENASDFQKLLQNHSQNVVRHLFGVKAILVEKTKLTFGVSQYRFPIPVFEVLKGKITKKSGKVSFGLQNKFIPKYNTQNVIAYIKGSQTPEKFMAFSAHYDHLGQIGEKVIFTGANDNAAGVAMLLRLAAYFKKHPPKFSVAFMAFGAEEAGLVGSKYYTEHPLFPLSNIKFLVNLDLVGTGSEGMTVVNGSIFQKEYDLLSKLNAEKNYLPNIQKRGEAANSDHYFFYKKNVPSFFIYLRGGIQAYHDIYDRSETLPLTKFEELEALMIEFATHSMSN